MRGPIRRMLLAASAVAGCLLVFAASSAMAAKVLTASGGQETGGLRDDLTTPPSSGNYGADMAAVNTAGALALTKGPPVTAVVQEKNPQFDVFVGLKLNSNPVVSETTCSAATGYVEFADLQNGVSGAGSNSPTYDTLTRWSFTINSANTKGCTGGTANAVTISSAGMYFPVLGVEVTGTIAGTYEQPGANCAGGGVKLALRQPGLLLNGKSGQELGFDNGAVEKNAFLCFTSSNNYVYPTVGKEPGTLTGSITAN